MKEGNGGWVGESRRDIRERDKQTEIEIDRDRETEIEIETERAGNVLRPT